MYYKQLFGYLLKVFLLQKQRKRNHIRCEIEGCYKKHKDMLKKHFNSKSLIQRIKENKVNIEVEHYTEDDALNLSTENQMVFFVAVRKQPKND